MSSKCCVGLGKLFEVDYQYPRYGMLVDAVTQEWGGVKKRTTQVENIAYNYNTCAYLSIFTNFDHYFIYYKF